MAVGRWDPKYVAEPTGHIQDRWDCKKTWGGNGVVHIMDLMDGI